jgi:hypothetical protein
MGLTYYFDYIRPERITQVLLVVLSLTVQASG